MGLPLQAPSHPLALLLVLILSALALVQQVAAKNDINDSIRSSWGHVGRNVVGKRGLVVHHVHSHERVLSKNGHHHPKFKPGPWKQAYATFYQGGSGTFGGACGYQDVVQEGYGLQTAALSSVLFNNGQTCGACYEIKCVNDAQWCQPGQASLKITATNLCPPNYYESSNNGGWCNPPREHFDIAQPVFNRLAKDYKAGIILVKGNKTPWTAMKRLWGQKWETDAMLVGQSLTFRVRAVDGRTSTAWHVAPRNWQFGQT